jgi:phosphohistidine phosphatase SixA
MPDDSRRFVVLVRHGKRHMRWDQSEADHELAGWNTAFSGFADPLQEVSTVSDFEAGLKRTVAIAGRIADELGREGVRIVRIRAGHHLVATQTAQAIIAVLRRRGLVAEAEPNRDAAAMPWDALDPNIEGVGERVRQAVENWRPAAPEAWILVGHQPQLTHIADTLTTRKIDAILPRSGSTPGVTLPLGGSEAACIDVDRRQVVWMLTEKSDALMKELQDKLKSKYDVAKFFLGAFVVNTGVLLNKDMFSSQASAVDLALAGLGVFCALVALGFTAATLFSYDRLLMPTEFWMEGKLNPKPDRLWRSAKRGRLLRPPSQAHLVIFYEMLHAWTWFFVPAVTFAFASIAFFVLSLANRAASNPATAMRLVPLTWPVTTMALLCAAAFAVGLVTYVVGRPKLGTPD